jgi:hypothetical protein
MRFCLCELSGLGLLTCSESFILRAHGVEFFGRTAELVFTVGAKNKLELRIAICNINMLILADRYSSILLNLLCFLTLLQMIITEMSPHLKAWIKHLLLHLLLRVSILLSRSIKLLFSLEISLIFKILHTLLCPCLSLLKLC